MELLTGPNLAALLTMPGIGEKRAAAIAQRYTNWDEFLAASVESLVDLLGAKTGQQVAAGRAQRPPTADLPAGVNVVSLFDSHYPHQLVTLPDKPLLLWWAGTLPPPDTPTLAVVGTRTPNEFGAHVARLAASEAAQHGIPTVSGLALGCDSIAHEASLDASVPTWAVVGQGIDTLPQTGSRAALAARIVANGGGLLSEVPPGTPVASHLLIRRNRLQSGLASAVLVAQTGLATGEKPAGTLHTARFALEQRRYLAVPNPPRAMRSDPAVAGNVALTSPYGMRPQQLHATKAETVALIQSRAPVADLIIETPGDLPLLWKRILGP